MYVVAEWTIQITESYLLYAFCLQNNFDPLRFAGGVVAFHTAFALLEKRRIENYEEKGEVFFGHPFHPVLARLASERLMKHAHLPAAKLQICRDRLPWPAHPDVCST